MRDFIMLSRTSGDNIDLNNLSQGRWDFLSRCINSAIWVSHGLRPARMHVILGSANPPKTVVFDNSIKKVNPDEKNIATWIKKVLEKTSENPGIHIEENSFQTKIKSMSDRKFYILHEKGKDIREIDFDPNPVFVLGDYIGLPPRDEEFVKRYAHELISIGPKSYLASQCISYINIELDRMGIE
jgi:tRNA (pseudouridine54-N1)-methyltransferase